MPLELQPDLKKQRVYSIDQKRWLIELRENNPEFKHARLAEEFKDKYGGDQLRSSTVSDWLKPAAVRKVLEQSSKDSVFSKKKEGSSRARDAKCHRLEAALTMWVEQTNAQNVTVTEEILVEKAKQLAEDFPVLEVPPDFAFSHGWVWRFKMRSNLGAKTRAGEAQSADMEGVTFARENLAKVLSKFPWKGNAAGDMEYVNFAWDNIFNMDETGLFWREQPSRTCAKGKVAGRKKEMQRVTVGLACNSTGTEKLRPIVVGKSAKPRCFKNKGKDWSVRTHLGMEYHWNKAAWMLGSIFSSWVLELNAKFAVQKRTCVLC